MFNKVYGVGFLYPTVFRENGKLWNLHFRPKFSKSWIHQIVHIKYWIINDVTNNASVMHENSKSQLHIFGADHQLFGKGSKKSGEISYWKKRRLPDYAPKVVKHLFTIAVFTSLIDKWLINHKELKLNDFGLKIRIFEISKIKILKKIFLLETMISSVKLLKQSDIGISPGISLKIELHCFERDETLNLFCRVYKIY